MFKLINLLNVICIHTSNEIVHTHWQHRRLIYTAWKHLIIQYTTLLYIIKCLFCNDHKNKSLKNIKYIWSLFMEYTCTRLGKINPWP